MESQYEPSNARADAPRGEPQFVGFWVRFVASVIDSVLVALIIYPLMSFFFGWDDLASGNVNPGASLLFELVLPAIAVIVFWIYRSATPGKMVMGAKIVDATTYQKPTNGQLIGRYFAYYVSMLPVFLGFIWVGFDKRKQGWHDKLARTVVIRTR